MGRRHGLDVDDDSLLEAFAERAHPQGPYPDILSTTFTAIVTAQDVGSHNPAAANFDALLARAAQLGVADGRLLRVAQSLFHDHVPATAAGLPTVCNRRHDRAGRGATPPAEGVTPDWEFPSMAAFAEACAAG